MVTVLCPPCSGSGFKRIPATGARNIEEGKCPLCAGLGEIGTEMEDRFWACVTRALDENRPFRLPWSCTGEELWR